MLRIILTEMYSCIPIYRGNAYDLKIFQIRLWVELISLTLLFRKLPSENLTDFQDDYIDLYGKLPNKESTRAYDLILDVILRIAFREKLKSIDIGETQYIENRFFYKARMKVTQIELYILQPLVI